MTSDPLGGFGKKARGYTKELVAEFTGDARLQEDGRRNIVEGRLEGAETTSHLPSSGHPSPTTEPERAPTLPQPATRGATMSEIRKTTKDGVQYREDGSKVATEDSPSGETETENVNREQSKLPNRGRSPEYDESDDSDIAAPSPPTGA
jgi:hypothetical protein